MKKKFRVSSLIKGIAVVYCLVGFVLFVVCIAISVSHDISLYRNLNQQFLFTTTEHCKLQV